MAIESDATAGERVLKIKHILRKENCIERTKVPNFLEAALAIETEKKGNPNLLKHLFLRETKPII